MTSTKFWQNCLITAFVFLLLVLGLNSTKDMSFNRIDLSNLINVNNEHIINPIEVEQYTTVDIWEYPYVRTPPWSLKYKLVLLNEQVDLYNGRYDKLFFATKRVAELNEWGNDLLITRKINNISDLKKISHYGIMDFSKNNNSWENIISQYSKLTEEVLIQYKQEPNNLAKLLVLKSYIQKNENVLYQTIFKLKTTRSKKQYLRKLISLTTGYLINKLPSNLDYPNPHQVLYQLSDFKLSKEFGFYTVTLKALDQLETNENSFQLKIKNVQHKTISKTSTNEFSFQNIKISPKTNKFELLIQDELSQQKNRDWTNLNNNSGEIILNPKGLTGITMVRIKYQTPKPLTIRIQQTFLERKQSLEGKLKINLHELLSFFYTLFNLNNKSEINYLSNEDSEEIITQTVLNEFLDPNDTDNTVVRVVRFRNDRNILDAKVVAESTHTLTTQDLANIRIELIPVFMPPLRLIKTKPLNNYQAEIKYQKLKPNHYQLLVNKTSGAQDNYIKEQMGWIWRIVSKQTINDRSYKLVITNKLHYVLRRLTNFIAILFLGFCIVKLYLTRHPKNWIAIQKKYKLLCINISTTVKTIVLYIKNHIRNITKFLISWGIKHRFPILLTTLLGIIFHVLILPVRSNWLVLSLVGLCIYSLKVFRRQSQMAFKLSILFTVLALVFTVFKLFSLAEMMALWVYLFLIIGVIMLLLEK